MENEHAVKWLKDAIRYFQQMQPHATTRWQAEQHQEREKACQYALDKIEGKAWAQKVLST